MSLKLQRYWDGQVRDMTQHRLTLHFFRGRGCDPVWNIFTCVRIINRKKRGGISLEKDEVQGCFDGRMKKQKGKQLVEFP